MSTPPFTERVAAVEQEQALQRKRVDDHDTVLVEFRELLIGLVARMDRLERKATIAFAIWIAGSQGPDGLSKILQAIGTG